MASNFVQFQAPPHSPRRWVSSAFARVYKDAHEDMLAAISAMDELTGDLEPNPLRLSHTRLRITRASMQCRSVFRKIATILSRDGAPAVSRALEALEGRHFELKELTSSHLAIWTPAQIQSNWEGYCRSSEEVRGRWRETIERERQLLYPLL